MDADTRAEMKRLADKMYSYAEWREALPHGVSMVLQLGLDGLMPIGAGLLRRFGAEVERSERLTEEDKAAWRALLERRVFHGSPAQLSHYHPLTGHEYLEWNDLTDALRLLSSLPYEVKRPILQRLWQEVQEATARQKEQKKQSQI